ncbi:hypothetical protein imdm_1330 [gamma proteobacterium IMCC2047]|nr:hypothetical protein imdm_1330 [gamma proteobacterium IMCC2047]
MERHVPASRLQAEWSEVLCLWDQVFLWRQKAHSLLLTTPLKDGLIRPQNN